MTEHEWFTEPDPAQHIGFVADYLDARRTRLLAVALCRSVWELFTDTTLQATVESAELFADELTTRDELEGVRGSAREIAIKSHEAYNATLHHTPLEAAAHDLRRELAWAAAYTAGNPVALPDVGLLSVVAAVKAVAKGIDLFPDYSPEWAELTAERRLIARSLVWDVAGNPYRPVTFDPRWRTGTAVALARQMYESREFSAMPILADALQDAGCGDEQVLNHCRGDGPHVRGCWVLDGVLNLV